MRKRYTLEQDVICHIFKAGTRKNGTVEPNDGSGGHATSEISSKISAYKIIGIPEAKKAESAVWFSDLPTDKNKLILCPFPHIATFTIANVQYTEKSMFPGNISKEELVKTMERALSSNTPSHTFNGQSRVNAASGLPQVGPSAFKRPLSDSVNGDYIEGRANGIRVRGQLKGGHGGLTSAFPNTVGFFRR